MELDVTRKFGGGRRVETRLARAEEGDSRNAGRPISQPAPSIQQPRMRGGQPTSVHVFTCSGTVPTGNFYFSDQGRKHVQCTECSNSCALYAMWVCRPDKYNICLFTIDILLALPRTNNIRKTCTPCNSANQSSQSCQRHAMQAGVRMPELHFAPVPFTSGATIICFQKHAPCQSLSFQKALQKKMKKMQRAPRWHPWRPVRTCPRAPRRECSGWLRRLER